MGQISESGPKTGQFKIITLGPTVGTKWRNKLLIIHEPMVNCASKVGVKTASVLDFGDNAGVSETSNFTR